MKIIPHLVEKPWAGKFLSQKYSAPHQKIGEAWLLSTLPEGRSKANDQDLSDYLRANLPFVVKIIDTDENLSIQVHPDDAWARKLENSKGKTECWLILNAQNGAGVYLGLKSEVSPEQFKHALESHGRPDELMNFFPVERGDFFTVPAGTIHAIGSGVTLLEVQQASGITYRLWDWGRTDRELHREKGLQVSQFAAPFTIRRNVIDEIPGLLLKHSDFECFINESHGEGWFIGLDDFEVSASPIPPSHSFVFVR